jgi:chemotaxis signal transduction protein
MPLGKALPDSSENAREVAMSETRKLCKCGKIAERILSLASLIAMEAASHDSRAFAVVADETEKLGGCLSGLVERAAFDELSATDFDVLAASAAEKLELLAVNSAIEALKSERGKGVAICADAIRRAALELHDICGLPPLPVAPTPEPAHPSLACGAKDYLLAFEVGDMRFVEGLRYVREVMRFDPKEEGGRDYDLRGRRIPLLDLKRRLGLTLPASGNEGRRLVVVNADWGGSQGKEYAVVVDRISPNALFRSAIGMAAPARAHAASLRECWDAADGSQFLFFDWPKLAR